jgi:uncharacterized BrkB/YihY/UPF0761 family membrane protein
MQAYPPWRHFVRRLAILAFLVIVLLAAGGITSQLTRSFDLTVPVTDAPDGSVFDATPDQALQFFVWVGFVLANVVVAGLVIALIFWWLHRSVRRSQDTEQQAQS